jgi:hypothetical protein
LTSERVGAKSKNWANASHMSSRAEKRFDTG